MIGWAVTRWWQGDVNVLGETLAICIWLICCLAVFLSVWWVGNKLEQRFEPHPPAKAKSSGLLQELKEIVSTKVSLPVVIVIGALSGWGPRRQQPGPPLRNMIDAEEQMSWPRPKVLQGRLQQQEATLRYWNTTVANLHAVRFETPSGQEPAEKYYERMFRQLRLQTEAARSASTANVDPELVQMVTRHLTDEDQILQLKQELDELMREQQIPFPSDTVDERMGVFRLLQGILEASPEVLEKMPPGPVRDWIEKGLVFEVLRQQQFRDIEIKQAVLQERYKGVAFPLPEMSP
jgi:hypothetical protein